MRYDWFNQPIMQQHLIGRTLYLVGTAPCGPSEHPIKAESLSHVQKTFGLARESVLTKGFEEAHASFPDIDYYLVRTGGTHAKASLLGMDIDDKLKKGLILQSRDAGQKCNEIFVRLSYITLNQAEKEWCLIVVDHNKIVAYPLNDYSSLNLLVKDINEHCNNEYHSVYAASEIGDCSPMALVGYNPEETFLKDGNDGSTFTKNKLYRAMTYTLSIIQGQSMDGIVLLGVYFDDVYDSYYYGNSSYDNSYFTGSEDCLTLRKDNDNNYRLTFHELLTDFCKQQERFGIMSHGFLGFRIISEPEVVSQNGLEFINHLIASTCLSSRHGFIDTGDIDKGYYISLIFGDLLFKEGSSNQYWNNGVALYAALWITNRFVTTTNIALPQHTTTQVMLDGMAIKQLTNAGVVTFEYSPLNKCLIVSSGVTPALPDSELREDINIKIVQYAVNYINAAISDLIGQDPNLPTLGKDLNDKVTDALEELKNKNLVPDYSFVVDVSTSTNWIINLSLAVRNCLEQINIPLMLALGGNQDGSI